MPPEREPPLGKTHLVLFRSLPASACPRAGPALGASTKIANRIARTALARHQIKRWGQVTRTSTASSGAGLRFGSGAMRQTGRHRHRRRQRLRNAADVQGADLGRMRSGGPAREASAAEPASGGGKCEVGAAESAWQADGAAAAAVRHWREL